MLHAGLTVGKHLAIEPIGCLTFQTVKINKIPRHQGNLAIT